MATTNKPMDFKITCQYYYDNSESDYSDITIENQNGYVSNNPEDWMEGQRMNMLRHLASALKLDVVITKK